MNCHMTLKPNWELVCGLLQLQNKGASLKFYIF